MLMQPSSLEATRVYHDLNSLAKIKAIAKDDEPAAIREAAKQFESIFMGMMLKSMRDANSALVKEPFMDSAQLGMYQEMYDEQLTLHLNTSGGLGLTDILVQQLSGKPAETAISQSENPKAVPDRVIYNNFTSTDSTGLLATVQASKMSANTEAKSNVLTLNDEKEFAVQRDSSSTASTENVGENKNSVSKSNTDQHGLDFSSPASFVQTLWPYAQKAAKALQLDPKLLIAQAALETGWGKFVMRTAKGDSSKNLFGIKASKDWSGDTTQVNTLEFESGALQRKNATFKSYQSYSDSFNDYAEVVSTKSRYQQAMNVSSNPELYTKELQTAGYATDPDYSSKINKIFNSPTLNNAINSLGIMP